MWPAPHRAGCVLGKIPPHVGGHHLYTLLVCVHMYCVCISTCIPMSCGINMCVALRTGSHLNYVSYICQ